MKARPTRPGQRGQAMAETGLVIVLLIFLGMGIVEFGRAFMVVNMITHATRDGARMAAVVPATARNSSGIITSTSSISTQVLSEIDDVMSTTGLAVAVTQPTISGIPMVSVRVSGSVPYLIQLWGATFAVDRTVVFRDEGR
jgi:Flp pilus assembly protein TadG